MTTREAVNALSRSGFEVYEVLMLTSAILEDLGHKATAGRLDGVAGDLLEALSDVGSMLARDDAEATK